LGSSSAERCTAGMDQVSHNSVKRVLRMLEVGRLDVVIHDWIEGMMIFKKAGIQSIKTLGPPLISREIYHFLHKKNEGIAAKINEVFIEMVNDGTTEQIKTEVINKLAMQS